MNNQDQDKDHKTENPPNAISEMQVSAIKSTYNPAKTNWKFIAIVAVLGLLAGGIILVFQNSFYQPKPIQVLQPSPIPSSTSDETTNEIDYYSCKDLEKLPYQYVESVQSAIGYLDISGTVELRSDGEWYLGSDQEVNGIYLKIPIQKTGEKGLFYSQFIEEAKGNSANADIEGEDLLFRLGEYDNKNIFSSRATVPQNFQSEIEKALQNKIPINLHLAIDLPPDSDAPSNTSGACKIDIF